jgi:hypothetical protein
MTQEETNRKLTWFGQEADSSFGFLFEDLLK